MKDSLSRFSARIGKDMNNLDQALNSSRGHLLPLIAQHPGRLSLCTDPQREMLLVVVPPISVGTSRGRATSLNPAEH